MCRLFLALFVVLSPLAAQNDEIKLKPAWMPKKVERPAEVDAATAKAAVKTFATEIKAKDTGEKLAAITKLMKGRNNLYVKPLSKLLRNKNELVRQRAAESLGALGYPKAVPALLKAVDDKKNRPHPAVIEAAGAAAGMCTKKSLMGKLEKRLRNGDMHAKLAAVLAFGHSKDMKSLGVLATWLEQPQPRSVNSPNNPPASYWRERYREWNYIRRQVSWALWAITGELFDTRDEVEEWQLEQQKKKRSRRKS